MTAGSWAWSMSHAHMDAEASLLASPQSQSYNNRFRYLLLTKVSPPSFIITICIRTSSARDHSLLCFSLLFVR